MFDEEAESKLEELADEMFAGLVDDRDLIFFEGGIVRSAPVGVPPEYITVEIEGIYDASVMWRGHPGNVQVGDEVWVWENPITHRREIGGSSGADATSPFVHDHSSLAQGGQDLHDIEEFEIAASTELTIVAGVITRTQSYHRVDTQGDAATDDLDTVNGGVTGDILIIRAENDARTVVVKHATGNIDLVDGTDITLDDTEDHLTLIYDGAVWCDVKGRQIIANGVTKTVGAAGDFTTIQGAVDWFKNRLVVGLCKIDVDAGSYDEAVLFEDIFIARGGALELEGDTRVLAGISYVDGAVCNQASLANGGTFNAANRCTLATNGARDQITVSGGTVDPDFDADGWGNGDEILVYADDGTVYERIINSISPGGAGNNVIEITVALPVGATLGNDATAICLRPDRQIARTAAGECVTVSQVAGVTLDGWYLDTASGANCNGILVRNGGQAFCENVAVRSEDFGFMAFRSFSRLHADDGACSAWDSTTSGFYAADTCEIIARYAVAVAVQNGFYTINMGYINARYAIAVNCSLSGFRAVRQAVIYAANCTARQCAVTGYVSQSNSYMHAEATNANNNGNGADYSPAPGIPGYAESVANFGVLYAS